MPGRIRLHFAVEALPEFHLRHKILHHLGYIILRTQAQMEAGRGPTRPSLSVFKAEKDAIGGRRTNLVLKGRPDSLHESD